MVAVEGLGPVITLDQAKKARRKNVPLGVLPYDVTAVRDLMHVVADAYPGFDGSILGLEGQQTFLGDRTHENVVLLHPSKAGTEKIIPAKSTRSPSA